MTTAMVQNQAPAFPSCFSYGGGSPAPWPMRAIAQPLPQTQPNGGPQQPSHTDPCAASQQCEEVSLQFFNLGLGPGESERVDATSPAPPPLPPPRGPALPSEPEVQVAESHSSPSRHKAAETASNAAPPCSLPAVSSDDSDGEEGSVGELKACLPKEMETNKECTMRIELPKLLAANYSHLVFSRPKRNAPSKYLFAQLAVYALPLQGGPRQPYRDPDGKVWEIHKGDRTKRIRHKQEHVVRFTLLKSRRDTVRLKAWMSLKLTLTDKDRTELATCWIEIYMKKDERVSEMTPAPKRANSGELVSRPVGPPAPITYCESYFPGLDTERRFALRVLQWDLSGRKENLQEFLNGCRPSGRDSPQSHTKLPQDTLKWIEQYFGDPQASPARILAAYKQPCFFGALQKPIDHDALLPWFTEGPTRFLIRYSMGAPGRFAVCFRKPGDKVKAGRSLACAPCGLVKDGSQRMAWRDLQTFVNYLRNEKGWVPTPTISDTSELLVALTTTPAVPSTLPRDDFYGSEDF